MRAFLQAQVKVDWTCIDIGPNIDTHALSLAAMATAGRVIAFEADPLNYAFLVRNAAKLQRPKARIAPLNLALWDSNTRLTIGGAE